MRFKWMLFILPVIFFAGILHAFAQGSLGDPIYTFDFGSGTSNLGPPLGLNPQGTNYTNLTYTTGCPGDGQYSIVHSLNSSNNCHEGVWQDLPTDYPGSSNGYFMLINASINPSVFLPRPCQLTFRSAKIPLIGFRLISATLLKNLQVPARVILISFSQLPHPTEHNWDTAIPRLYYLTILQIRPGNITM